MKKNIPNFITLLNLLCGVLATEQAISGNYLATFLLVSLGILFDFFDGFVARLLKVQSELGLQLDSLADVITSGVVPSFVMYQLLMQSAESSLEAHLIFAGLLIAPASAYRLAKFNIDTRQSLGFIGLPTPANSLFICSLPFFVEKFPIFNHFWLLLSITILFCYLLNSEIKLFALKFKSFNFKENTEKYIFLIISVILIGVLQIIAVPIIILLYIIISVIFNQKK